MVIDVDEDNGFRKSAVIIVMAKDDSNMEDPDVDEFNPGEGFLVEHNDDDLLGKEVKLGGTDGTQSAVNTLLEVEKGDVEYEGNNRSNKEHHKNVAWGDMSDDDTVIQMDSENRGRNRKTKDKSL
mmetsp:Transcript_4045/g.7765  ORF Transcript_4045/g.7765 Transcript_4045/m.7765 type:complete len:125 (-) Transcript_4045:27-401(-)